MGKEQDSPVALVDNRKPPIVADDHDLFTPIAPHMDGQLGNCVKDILHLLGEKLVPGGRLLKSVNLHVNAETGDVDLDIVDEERSDSNLGVVEEQNRIDIIMARRNSHIQKVREARLYFRMGEWNEGLSLLCTIVNDPALDDDVEFRTSVRRMRAEVERYIDRMLKPEPVYEDISVRKPVELREKHWESPQSIFFLHTIDGVYVGRKLLSEDWINGSISELFCARLRSPMILGRLCTHRVAEREVIIHYRPVSRAETESIFKKAISDSSAEILFPFVYLTEGSRSELVSPSDGWYVDESMRAQLFHGEAFLRNYTRSRLEKFIPNRAILYDPACSTGDFLSEIQKSHPESKSIGQDLSSAMIEFAKTKLDIAFVGDAISSPLEKESVDVLFLRFLNSEVVSTAYAAKLYDAIVQRVKPKGLIVIFGHTPVLLDSGFMENREAEIINKIGHHENSMFQWYLLRKNG